MTTHEFCTYFDSGYLPRARVLHDSLVATGVDFRLTALCLDESALAEVETIGAPTFRAIALDELEAHDPELLDAKPSRSRFEYYFTLGPSFMRYLMGRDGLTHLTYLDADMCFYSSPEPLFEESNGAAVVVVGHRFPDRLRHLEETGRFNVAWVGFSNDAEGVACLEWWRSRCLEWCYDRVEGDRYADQRYLDQFPERFRRVHELQHPGADVAPWNLADPPIEWDGDRFVVAGEPLVFFHFQGFRQVTRRIVDPNLTEYGNRATMAVRRLYRDYVERLTQACGGAFAATAPRRADHGKTVVDRLRLARAMLRREVIVAGSERSLRRS